MTIYTFIPEKVHIMELRTFVKQRRTAAKLTQPELAEKAGVGLRFLRELEQGKESLRLDKVNQVLKLFGYKVGAVQLIVEEDEKG
jgi:y4mF family transcriptional regulator